MRQAMGTAVFFGMLGVTFFGVFFTPVFFNVIRRLTRRNVVADSHTPANSPAPEKHP
jgi:multidrug efflux pump